MELGILLVDKQSCRIDGFSDLIIGLFEFTRVVRRSGNVDFVRLIILGVIPFGYAWEFLKRRVSFLSGDICDLADLIWMA